MIDFSGVVSMADAIGGVPVCVEHNVYSHDSTGHGSGLKLTEGHAHRQGQAGPAVAAHPLRLRGRHRHRPHQGPAHVHELDGPPAAQRTPSSATRASCNSLAETATKALTVDHGLGTLEKLYDLGIELKKVPTERITMTTMPWHVRTREDSGRVRAQAGRRRARCSGCVREDIALDGKGREPDPTATAGAPAASPRRVPPAGRPARDEDRGHRAQRHRRHGRRPDPASGAGRGDVAPPRRQGLHQGRSRPRRPGPRGHHRGPLRRAAEQAGRRDRGGQGAGDPGERGEDVRRRRRDRHSCVGDDWQHRHGDYTRRRRTDGARPARTLNGADTRAAWTSSRIYTLAWLTGRTADGRGPSALIAERAPSLCTDAAAQPRPRSRR